MPVSLDTLPTGVSSIACLRAAALQHTVQLAQPPLLYFCRADLVESKLCLVLISTLALKEKSLVK